MRILVTKEGSTIIQEIEDSLPTMRNFNTFSNNFRGYRGHSTGRLISSPKYKKNQMKINNYTKTNNNIYKRILSYKNKNQNENENQQKLGKTKTKLIRHSTFLTKMNLEDIEISKEAINSVKHIKVSEQKIVFPKQFVEKYESYKNEENIINSNNLFPSIIGSYKENYEGANSSRVNKEKEKLLSFKEILPKKLIIQMKKKILKDRKIRERSTIVTSNDFRSGYEQESEIQKFDTILSEPRVNSNKYSLIKYLNEKKINPLTIKIISNKDGIKINKINKMCKRIFQNDEKEKKFNDLIKKKINDQINFDKKECQNTIKYMGKKIEKIKDKLKTYKKINDNREKFRDLFHDFVVNNWLKRDLERFNKKSTPKSEYIKTFLE